MAPSLARNVKARANLSEDENDYEEYSDDSSPSVIETGEGDEDEILSSSDEGNDDQEQNVKDQLSNISFGTLSKAQDSISRKRSQRAVDEEKEDETCLGI